MNRRPDKEWFCIELPCVDYGKAWGLQGRLVAARKERGLEKDLVLFLEHPPVFTLGRRGGLKNLAVPREFLHRRGIQVVQVERGGDITYHGPGQLVAYPIIDLRAARLTAVEYVGNLEEIMIRTAGDWSIHAERSPANRGVWTSGKKLGSIGIAIRHGVCFHGAALNVNVSLEPFDWIHPCGLKETGMTSMEMELGRSVPMDQVREAAKRHVEAVFGIELETIALEALPGTPGFYGNGTQDSYPKPLAERESLAR